MDRWEERMRERADEASRRRAADDAAAEKPLTAVCGCGRDFLTVPLEEAHECPNPMTR